MPTTKKELSFITVIGKDRKGIVASISALLYKNDINIEDIMQKITQGYFVMSMLVDIHASKMSIDTLRAELEKIGKKLGIGIQIQHENIFKMMHRI